MSLESKNRKIQTNVTTGQHPFSIKKGTGNGQYPDEIFYVDEDGKMMAKELEIVDGKIVASEIDATSKIGTSDFTATNSIKIGSEDSANKIIRMVTKLGNETIDACIRANSFSGGGTAIYLGALPTDAEDDGDLENLQYLNLQAEEISAPSNGVKVYNEWNFKGKLLYNKNEVVDCSNGRLTLQYDGDRLAVYYNGNYVGSITLTS